MAVVIHILSDPHIYSTDPLEPLRRFRLPTLQLMGKRGGAGTEYKDKPPEACASHVWKTRTKKSEFVVKLRRGACMELHFTVHRFVHMQKHCKERARSRGVTWRRWHVDATAFPVQSDNDDTVQFFPSPFAIYTATIMHYAVVKCNWRAQTWTLLSLNARKASMSPCFEWLVLSPEAKEQKKDGTDAWLAHAMFG